MEELRELLIKNNYPQQIIQKEFDKFEKYKMLNVDKIQTQMKKQNTFQFHSLTTNQKL